MQSPFLVFILVRTLFHFGLIARTRQCITYKSIEGKNRGLRRTRSLTLVESKVLTFLLSLQSAVRLRAE